MQSHKHFFTKCGRMSSGCRLHHTGVATATGVPSSRGMFPASAGTWYLWGLSVLVCAALHAAGMSAGVEDETFSFLILPEVVTYCESERSTSCSALSFFPGRPSHIYACWTSTVLHS